MLKPDLSKEYIDSLKNDENGLFDFIRTNNDRSILYLLDKLGRLENGYSKKPLLSLLKHENENIRVSTVKNLSKFSDITLLDIFLDMTIKEKSTIVRREAVSAIGRIKHQNIIPHLLILLKDNDPKVVMQAIRGLMNFNYIESVKSNLMDLINHPNEVIKDIIIKEFYKTEIHSDDSHIDFPDNIKNLTVNGDVLEVLKFVKDDSIHLTFTSPPYYNARDYSIYQSYQDYLDFLETVFKEIYRVTKEGRYFIINTSPIIIPRVSRSHSSKRYPIPYDLHPLIIKNGWEFIDDIIWVKPEASVKDRNSGFRQHRKPLAYKPNSITEMIMVYRKKTDKLLDWNIRQYNNDTVNKSKINENIDKTNVWYIDPTFDKIHSAVFPIELCNKIIKYYSMKGDLVFDPFAGSGTVAKAAISLDRNFFLTEKDPKYFNRIKEVLGFIENQNNFFSIPNVKFLTLQQFSLLNITDSKIDFTNVSEQKINYKKRKNDSNKNRNRKNNKKITQR